jgi:tetratricopeptide (TPR) repeat protein
MVTDWVKTTRRWPSFAWLTRWWPASEARTGRAGGQQACSDAIQRASTVRYYLGRGRRARETGRFEDACSHARRAIDANPGNPWAHALLGQCLMRQRHRDLVEARRSFERACALDPANGYFVRLLLEALDALGDAQGREDVLAWAWWSGAPVERWLPDGPIRRGAARTPSASDAPMPDPARVGIMQPVPSRPLEAVGAPARVLV